MRKFLTIMMILLAVASVAAQTDAGRKRVHTRSFVRTDTVTQRDTIIVHDVIKRQEVVTQTDVVVRRDTVKYRNGERLLIRGKDLPPVEETVFESGVAGGVDTVYITLRDTVRVAGSEVAAEGGRYVWVPDSMMTPVDEMLAGNLKAVREFSESDPNELVTFRGDTIPMMLRSRNYGRFDRGLFNYLFIPKGVWQIGMTASYGEISTEDLEIFSLVSDMDIKGRMFSIKPYFSYFIRNNLSVGMRFSYTSGRGDINSFQVDIDDDMNFNLKDIKYRSEQYTASVILNQYFGIARRGRFGIFNETELAFSSGNSDFGRPYAGVVKNTHTTTMQAALNFSPGVAVFIMENVSFNVSFGVFGFYLRNEKQTVDDERLGSRFSSGANFRFNIFNINFGIAINI